jgi:signal transduction histidine kinase
MDDLSSRQAAPQQTAPAVTTLLLDAEPQQTLRPLQMRHPRLAELVTTAVAVLSALAGAVNYLTLGQPFGLLPIGLALAGVALVARWPWAGVALAFAAPLVGSIVAGVDPLVLWSIAAFIILIAGSRGLPPLPAGVPVGVSSYLAVVIYGPANYLSMEIANQRAWLQPLPIMAFVVVVAFAFIGASLRTNQLYWATLARSADEALATREAEADRRVAQERLRIAHDLHDTLGHEVALVSMSVGAAEVHLETNPDAARADLAQARQYIQKVLDETQRVLAVLRNPSDNTPAAGYAEIDHLIAEFTTAGMNITATVADEPAGLDAEVGAASYRIVQESLVNARKHGTGVVRLQVSVAAGNINIEVVNRRAPKPTDGPRTGGYGLIGMRERAASAGGRIDVDEDDVLFTLRATLPVKGKAR